MDHSKFRKHLDASVEELVKLANELCFNNLSNNYLFTVTPSEPIPHDGLNDKEIAFLLFLNTYKDKRLNAESIASLLCIDNKVPLWINTTIYEATESHTSISLLCSRRLRADTDLNYKADKYPPFHILIFTPPEYSTGGEQGKFDINWKKDFDSKRPT